MANLSIIVSDIIFRRLSSCGEKVEPKKPVEVFRIYPVYIDLCLRKFQRSERSFRQTGNHNLNSFARILAAADELYSGSLLEKFTDPLVAHCPYFFMLHIHTLIFYGKVAKIPIAKLSHLPYPIFSVKSCRLLSYCICVIAPCSRNLG